MKLITISREFGSGGRELGKRMADILGFDYYDREIITAIAEHSGLDANYIENALEQAGRAAIPITFSHTFMMPGVMTNVQTDILAEQRRVLDNIAAKGSNAIIVGRNADVLLASSHPFNIFVCADMEARIARCRERADSGEQLSDRELKQNIQRIDRNRAQTREIMSGGKWGERSQYHLIVNTTGWSLKELAPAVADYASRWFNRS